MVPYMQLLAFWMQFKQNFNKEGLNMLSYALVLCGTLIFIRLFLNKFNMEHKDIIAIGLSVALTTFLSIIQWAIGFIINIIF